MHKDRRDIEKSRDNSSAENIPLWFFLFANKSFWHYPSKRKASIQENIQG